MSKDISKKPCDNCESKKEFGKCTSNRPLGVCTAPCSIIGPTGPTGPTGTVGGYGYFYSIDLQRLSLMPGNEFVEFRNDGPFTTPPIQRTTNPEEIVLTETGTYYVIYYIYVDEPSQFQLYLDGTPIQPIPPSIAFPTLYGQSNVSSPNIGNAIIRVDTAPATLTLRLFDSISGGGPLNTVQGAGSSTGNASNVNASISIIKLD